MEKLHKNTFRSSFVAPPRLVFQEKPKGPEPQKSSEKKEAGKPSIDQKAQTYKIEDLKKARTDAEFQLIGKIAHPDVLANAQAKLKAKLDPLESQLNKLEEDKTAERLKIKSEVEGNVREILREERRFEDIKVDVNGKALTFLVKPPQLIDKYGAMESKAFDSASIYNPDKPGGKVESTSFINGQINMKVILDRPAGSKLPEGAYKIVLIDGLKMTEIYSDTKLDKERDDASSFQDAFNNWRKDSKTTFTYGDPEKSFPPAGFDLQGFMKERHMGKADLTIDAILSMKKSPSSEMTGEDKALQEKLKPVFDLDVARTEKTYVFARQGERIGVKSLSSGDKKILSGEGNIAEMEITKEGRILREKTVRYEIVSQQRRKVETVTEYWPEEKGKERKIRKTEEYRDGVVTGESKFDKEGNLLERISRVKGCPGIEAVEKPVGPPYVDVAVLGEHGEKERMERKMDRVMIMRDEKGKETGRIRTIESENNERKKRGLKPLTESEYIDSLAKQLKTKEQQHAFLNLMLRYRYDETKEGAKDDKWQTPEETVKRIENGQMRGDCEDYAFLMRDILKKQGKDAYVVYLPGHAECVTVTQDAKGKYHAVSYGTFGVDVNGNVIGENADANKAKGYDTPKEAVQSLQNKWHAKNSGNVEMGTGDLFSESLGKLTVMQFEYDFIKISALQFNDKGVAKDDKGVEYKKFSDGRIGKFVPTELDKSLISVEKEEVVTKPAAPKVAPVAVPRAVPATPKVTPAVPSATPSTTPSDKPQESPEVKDAREKALKAGRGVLASFIGKSLDELNASPNLGVDISSAIEARIKAAGLPNVDVNIALPGKISVSINKGKVVINGTDGYAAKLIKNRTDLAAEKKDA